MSSIVNYFSTELEKESKKVEKLFLQEVDLWVKGSFKCKFIILGEAPLTTKQFFYNKKTGSYLSFLKQHYEEAKKLKDEEFKGFLREKGILNLDIYKYPLPTSFYDNDKMSILFDESHLANKISVLTKLGLIDSTTVYVYRYQKLLDRELFLRKPLSSLNKKNHITTAVIAIGANASNINPDLTTLLP
jgi:hypothetical protein